METGDGRKVRRLVGVARKEGKGRERRKPEGKRGIVQYLVRRIILKLLFFIQIPGCAFLTSLVINPLIMEHLCIIYMGKKFKRKTKVFFLIVSSLTKYPYLMSGYLKGSGMILPANCISGD